MINNKFDDSDTSVKSHFKKNIYVKCIIIVLLALIIFTIPVYAENVYCLIDEAKTCQFIPRENCLELGSVSSLTSISCQLGCYRIENDAGEEQYEMTSNYYAENHQLEDYDLHKDWSSERCEEENRILALYPENYLCSNNIDDDNDGRTDLDDIGCGNNPFRQSEDDLSFCANNDAVTEVCSCGGTNYEGGYCCNNQYSTTECPEEFCLPGERVPIGEFDDEGCPIIKICGDDGVYSAPLSDPSCEIEACREDSVDCTNAACNDVLCGTSSSSSACDGLGYSWDAENPTNLYCCSSGLLDCDDDGVSESCGVCDCEARQQPPFLTPIIQYMGQKKFLIQWNLDCDVEFTVMKKVDGGVFYSITSNQIDERSYLDENILPEKTYSYKIIAYYGETKVESNIQTLYSGDAACFISEQRKLCMDSSAILLGRQNKVECNNANVIVSNVECSEDKMCIGPDSSGRLNCVDEPGIKCALCSTPLGLYPKETCDELCYQDSFTTIKDSYNSCDSVSYCADYHSKAACQENECLSRICEWSPVTNSLLGALLGKGVCVENDESISQCQLGSQVGDYVYGGVNQLTCEILSNDVPCLLKDQNCAPLSQVTCQDFRTNSECTGGVQTQFDIRFSDETRADRINGTNSIIVKNNNPYLSISDNKFALCRWDSINKVCYKDADYNFVKDNDDAGDMTPPVTTLISNSIARDFSFTFTSNDPEEEIEGVTSDVKYAFYCISPESSTCYPGNRLNLESKADTIDVTFNIENGEYTGEYTVHSGEGDGKYKIKIYAEDNANNLEIVKIYHVTVDRLPPEIDINYNVLRDPEKYAKIDLNIHVNEEVNCYDSFAGREQNELRRYSPDNEIIRTFDAQNDGYYEYSITCVDDVGNEKTETEFIKVDLDLSITNPKPSGIIDERAPKEMSILTQSSSACSFRRLDGTDFSGTFDVVREGSLYKQFVSFSPEVEGLHKYQVTCPGNKKDQILFVYDTTSPLTSIVNGQDVLFDRELIYTEGIENEFYLKCADLPIYGFDCNNTLYCYEENECVPSEEYRLGHPVEPTSSEADEMWLCYYSIENEIRGFDANLYGGKTEQVKCREIKVDNQLPELILSNLFEESVRETYITSTDYVVRGEIIDHDAISGEEANKIHAVLRDTSGAEHIVLDKNSSPVFGRTFEFDVIFSEPTDAQEFNYLSITAFDRQDTASETKTAKVKVGAPPENLIRLKYPKNGVSSEVETDITILAAELADWCYIGQPLSMEEFHEFAESGRLERLERRVFEDVDDEITGLRWYAYTTHEKQNLETPGAIVRFGVMCNLASGRISYEIFEITYDNTPPKIISLTVSPSNENPDNLMVVERAPVELLVKTDDPSRCKYSDRISHRYGNGMTPFDNFNEFTFENENTQTISVEDKASYTYYVVCQNAAEQWSEVNTLRFSVDYDAPTQVILKHPKSPTGQENTKASIHTTKSVSSCNLIYEERESPMTREGDNRNWNSSVITLKQGNNVLSFKCISPVLGEEDVTQEFRIVLDKTPPVIAEIMTLNITSKTVQASSQVIAYDNESGISAYSFKIGNAPGDGSIKNWTTSENSGLNAYNLNLSDNSFYYWTVKVQNGVGLWSNDVSSRQVRVDVDYDPSPVDSCENGIWDAGEADIDCGGECQDKCDLGSECIINEDCASNTCIGGVCETGTCFDNIKNQGEVDIDCGGPNCPLCGFGKSCRANSDCSTGYCDSLHICSEVTCDDGVKNGDEEGVDCGGSCSNSCTTSSTSTTTSQPEEEKPPEKKSRLGAVILLILLILILGGLVFYVYYVKVMHGDINDILQKIGLVKKKPIQQKQIRPQQQRPLINPIGAPGRFSPAKVDRELIEKRREARKKQRELLLSKFENKDESKLEKLKEKPEKEAGSGSVPKKLREIAESKEDKLSTKEKKEKAVSSSKKQKLNVEKEDELEELKKIAKGKKDIEGLKSIAKKKK